MNSSNRNCLNIKTIIEAVKQQIRHLRIERLTLAISRFMKKNGEIYCLPYKIENQKRNAMWRCNKPLTG